MQAVARFLIWQIKSRIFRKEFIHNWIGNSKFYVKNGETGLTQNIYVGLAEYKDMCFLIHLLNENDYFVDVGSNSGSYSILAGSVAQSKVISIEPVRDSFERLLRNIELNGLDHKSKALNVGLGAKSGFLSMTSKFDTTNQIVIEDKQTDTILVQIRTLDEICKFENPTLIKIDVEGWETEVLKGGIETLQNPKLLAIIIELNESGNRYGFSDLKILEMLKNFGFYPYKYDPLTRTLTLLEGKDSQAGNTILVRNLAETKRRIDSSPKRIILGNSI
jgi:FkbM family methyltransferase